MTEEQYCDRCNIEISDSPALVSFDENGPAASVYWEHFATLCHPCAESARSWWEDMDDEEPRPTPIQHVDMVTGRPVAPPPPGWHQRDTEAPVVAFLRNDATQSVAYVLASGEVMYVRGPGDRRWPGSPLPASARLWLNDEWARSLDISE